MKQYCKNCKYYIGEVFISHGLGEWGRNYECCSTVNSNRICIGQTITGEKKYHYPILKSMRFKTHNSDTVGVDYYTFINDKVYVAIRTLNFDFQCPYYKRKWWKFWIKEVK